MTSRTKLWALSAGALALSLALAGCGGGGSSGSPQTAVTGSGGGGGGGGGGGSGSTESKIPLSYATALNTAVAKLTTLSGDANGSALMMAKDASGKLGVLASGGESSAAMMSAQTVLSAQMMLKKAVEDAGTAKTAAMEQKAKLSATDDVDVIAALDNAITAADTQIEAAQALLDAKATEMGSLAYYARMVTGADEDDLMDAADKGKEVADAIYTALTTGAQLPAVETSFGSVPTATSATVGKTMMGPSDAQGMTWAEIGGSGLMDMQIAAGAPTGAATRAVMAKSVAGMTAGDLFSTVGNAPSTTENAETDGDVEYKGIAGVLICAGEDCGVENVVEGTFAATSKLTGSWYFAPDLGSMTTYVAGTTAGTYRQEVAGTDYVRYGYWLSVASATDDTTTINRYVSGPSAQTAAVYGVDANVKAFAGTSARYLGKAVGMSVVMTTDNSGKELTRASGGFTADVDLTMTFGGSPMLAGTISKFQGSAVDTGWSVDLKSSGLSSTTGQLGTETTDRTVGGDATSGSWTATAWGGAASDTSADTNPAARPAGVYGAFDANFTNGAAAGVYATRKQ